MSVTSPIIPNIGTSANVVINRIWPFLRLSLQLDLPTNAPPVISHPRYEFRCYDHGLHKRLRTSRLKLYSRRYLSITKEMDARSPSGNVRVEGGKPAGWVSD